MKEKVSIVSMASISALGIHKEEVWNNYLQTAHTFKERPFGKFKAFTSDIQSEHWQDVNSLKEDSLYKDLDPSVLLAISASRKAIAGADWRHKNFGINIGSSRGATHLYEKFHNEFLNNPHGKVSTLSSPTTTLGNISSWVGHDAQSSGPTISHSIACSTALHAILNGIAWLSSGMSDCFLAGGTESSNTPFTLAQMKALKIYANEKIEYPCRTLDFDKKRNSMILGEGCAVFCLELGIKKNALAFIEGIGYATEPLKHNISISTNADCFQTSMKMAMKQIDQNEVDAIVMHAPGTIKGDLSEFNAIHKVFGDAMPALTSNKWKIGHTLGASGGLSMEMAILMMKHQKFIGVPFIKNQSPDQPIKKVLVNSVGFGGNAVSILVSLD